MNELASADYFRDAEHSYSEGRKRFYDQRKEHLRLRDMAAAMDLEMKDIEAEMIANNGTEGHPLDGRNAETRDAQLRTILKTHRAYQQIQDRLITVRIDAAVAEVEAADAANEMSLAKRRMDRGTAETQLEAATLMSRDYVTR